MRRTFWNNGCQIHDNTSAHFFDYWQKNLQTQFFKLCMHARYEFLQKRKISNLWNFRNLLSGTIAQFLTQPFPFQISFEWPLIYKDDVEYALNPKKSGVFFHEENICKNLSFWLLFLKKCWILDRYLWYNDNLKDIKKRRYIILLPM